MLTRLVVIPRQSEARLEQLLIVENPSQRKVLPHRIGDLIIGVCDGGFAFIEALRRRRGRRPVESISTDQVRKCMVDEDPPIILVDVRGEAERSVSRIPDSITAHEYESNRRRYADKIIVPYCTVGGRSYLYARRLVEAGTASKNYRASILGWCRSGLPLETADGQPTNRVHPYWRIFSVPDDYEAHT